MIEKKTVIIQAHTYTFRAECRDDVLQFLALPETSSLKKIIITPDPMFPDVEVEIETELTLKNVMNALELIEDGHVMVESLEENPHRSYSFNC